MLISSLSNRQINRRLKITIKMKNLLWLAAMLLLVSIYSCERDDGPALITAPPTNLSANVDITQDDSGVVTVTPSADNAKIFEINWGDGSSIQTIAAGFSAQHTYAEGSYNIIITARNDGDDAAEIVQPIMVSFTPPSNLVIGLVQDANDPATYTVTPTASAAMMFDIDWGDGTAVSIMAGESASNTYTEAGDYTISVVARSASSTTINASEMITVAAGAGAIAFPVDFESSASVNYSFTSFGPDGVFTGLVDNPNPSGINTSATVVEYLKPNGSEIWAGTLFELGEPIDFANNNSISIKVHSPKADIPLILKVENLADGSIASELSQNIPVADEWVEMIYTFPAIDLSQSFQRIVLFFDFGTSGDDSVYFFDDITSLQIDPPACEDDAVANVDPANGDILWTFEGGSNPFDAFGNISAPIVMNPDPGGVNSSCYVQQYNKTTGCETWSGVGLELASIIDFSSTTSTMFSIDVYAETQTTDVTLRLERLPFPDVDPAVDVVQSISQTGQWETLTFDFSGHSDKTFKSMILYFERDAVCDGDIYYFDNIRQFDPADCTPETLENNDVSTGPLNLTFDTDGAGFSFGGFGGISTAVVDNPMNDAVNNSCNVMSYTLNDPCEVWGGSGVEIPIALVMDSNTPQISLKVFGSRAVDVTIVLERLPFPDVDPAVTVVQSMTKTNEWEELTFDFSGHEDKTFKNLLVYFDRGLQPCDGSTFYFDDFRQVP